MHCADPGCLKACPAPGAIIQYANGIVDFHQENCIGCGYCVTGCPFNIPRISQEDSKAYKCTLCSDRVAVGQAPACAKACPTGAIQFGTKEQMKDYADKRIADLKSRGFEKAGLYDPPGVGGTHVMYVLHHADQPELYSGLPDDPASARWCRCGRASPSRWPRWPWPASRWAACSTTSPRGRTRSPRRLEDELEKEDAQMIRNPKDLKRYTAPERANHWVVGISFILLALSGLAFFHPAFLPLTQLFGGGVWARILHPFIGVLMALSFLAMFFRFGS